ncbi:hypothetical protein GCM10017744_067100 [Streptomyces antimycoticus]|uniref:Uncharacterized protein n=2 Tax=Streptomyces antimycoticus TaxID=68175 RepID=A0A4D4K377_9ACTN|nr:hypothetical protein SANT12839_034860 [Streptomyces antimycoticus]
MKPEEYPEVRSWIESLTGSPDFVDFLTHNCSVGMWLAFSHLVNPEFIEIHGCILWERKYNRDRFEEWWQHLDGNVYAIENTLNRFVVADVVPCEESPENDSALADIADAIAGSWEHVLARTFPDRAFKVHVLSTDDGPTIVFHQACG